MDDKSQIALDRSSVNIVKKCGRALKDIIKMKFGCEVTFSGVDFEGMAQQKKPTLVPEERFSVLLKSGVKVSVWKADLTNFQVDAVVNAANENLQHYGGLALALSEAGGPQIQRDSNDYISKYGKVNTGHAIPCDPGFLPCKNLIHAVGPVVSYSTDVYQAEPLLKKAIISILDIVKKNKLKSVAIPAISSGLFNYPLTQCADTIVSTVKEYYQNPSQGHLPQEVRLVNHDEPTVKEMERACRERLDPHMHMTYSQAAGSKSPGAARNSTPAVKIGKVLLTLKKGKIEEQQTDVIVNTTSPDLDLKLGTVSKALVNKAGPGMQKEIRIAPRMGNVITTNSYNLHCKEVYHTYCIENRKHTAQKVLFNSVLECLNRAAAHQHRSIAFPAIGTGGLGFSKKEAATIMSEAVAEFAQKTPDMMDVHFVIFPSDIDTFKAFEDQIGSFREKASHSSVTHALEPRDDTSPPTSQINMIGPSKEAILEAERWLNGLLFKPHGSMKIYNNFIQHFGEQEYQQLSRLTKNGVSIEESFVKGHESITIIGNPSEDVVVAWLQVEAMLCKIQGEFVTEEENAIFLMSVQKVSFERKMDHHLGPLFSDTLSVFKQQGLKVLKMEKVENPALETLFDLKAQQLKCFDNQRMFQRIPAQFCDMVCRIGFHAEFAPPEDPAYGEGIYFAHKVKKAMQLWKNQNEEYLYFVLAEVLKGNSTPGKPGLILPPPVGKDPQIVHDSVEGGADITVIFSTYQALPRYILTCKVI